MANTGIKQATVAYKVSRPDGIPLDTNGNPVSLSGKRQAIALLENFPNPNPALYEVETYFTAGGSIAGNPTQTFDTDTCPIGITPPWVLDTGLWNMSGYWFNTGIWNF